MMENTSPEYQVNILIDILSEMVTSYLANNKNMSVDKEETQSEK